MPPLRIIEQHKKTRWHVYRFGGGLPERPPNLEPPTTPTDNEANYVPALLDAYADYLNYKDLPSIDELTDEDLQEHFADARIEFYSAESLRVFSRDTLPPGELENLQDEVYGGIKNEIRNIHPDGYRRILAVTKLAKCLQLSSKAPADKTTPRDRGGFCHQLANDLKIAHWVKR